MSERKATVTMGAEAGEEQVVPPHKPVAEMDEDEKEAYRQKLLKHVEKRVAVGNQGSLFEVTVPDERYPGAIRFKRPSLDEERQIGIRVAKYLQGAVGADVKTENLAIFFATMDVCVEWESAPTWFDPQKLPGSDYSVLEYVYGRFAEYLGSFRKFVPPSQPERREAATGAPGLAHPKHLQSAADGPAV